MNIENRVVEYFNENNLFLATAESCTGGLISKRITDVPGASGMFGYGLCTYANEAKVRLLKVSETTLAKYGAVSEQTAFEMASGLLNLSGADVAVCTTGMASPGGLPTSKPVGLVYIGIGSKKNGIRTIKLNLAELVTREKIRNAASDFALKEALFEAEMIVKAQ